MNRSDILNSRWKCECGETHDVPVQKVLIGAGAISKIPEILKTVCHSERSEESQGLNGTRSTARGDRSGADFGKSTGRAFLLADEITYDVAGRLVEKLLKRGGIDVSSCVLKGKPSADDKTTDYIAKRSPYDLSVIVSCGSGTITDLAKWTAFKRNTPQIAVATAPSMNGYASGVVALTRKGLKTTDAARPPVAVIADIDILAAAPLEMILAGLGDLISKPVCNADWKLASIIRGEHFCERPFEMIKDLEKLYIKDSRLIKKRAPKIIAALTEALIYSGISMVIAGSSQPASGGEHLISHFLDMMAIKEGRAHDLHGAQVGVATIATARLYERLMSISARDLDRDALSSIYERYEALSSGLDPVFLQKKKTRSECEKEGIFIASRWDEIKESVSPYLMKSEKIRAVLDAAGAKAHYADISASRDRYREALLSAMCIRNRYTVLDLAFAVGELNKWAEEIL